MKNEDEIGIARALDEATLRLMPNNDIAYSPVTRIIREKKHRTQTEEVGEERKAERQYINTCDDKVHLPVSP